MACSEVDLINCPVCFEEYRESGNNIPRILPCTHTVCQKCVEELLQNKELQCPECRVKHPASKGILSFPQNKYILSHIRALSGIAKNGSSPIQAQHYQNSESSPIQSYEICQKHNKALNLFCNRNECQVAICRQCMVYFHTDHDVKDINDDHEKPLSTSFGLVWQTGSTTS